MSLSSFQSFVFKCDQCGREKIVGDAPWEGRPSDWEGPERDDGHHLCNTCRLYPECPFGCGAAFVRLDEHFCATPAGRRDTPESGTIPGGRVTGFRDRWDTWAYGGGGTPGTTREEPRPFRYHRFTSLPKNGWSAKGWYDGGDASALPTPPCGWRWLMLRECVRVNDLCCDPRSDPVVVIESNPDWTLTPQHHPILRKQSKNGGTE